MFYQSFKLAYLYKYAYAYMRNIRHIIYSTTYQIWIACFQTTYAYDTIYMRPENSVFLFKQKEKTGNELKHHNNNFVRLLNVTK